MSAQPRTPRTVLEAVADYRNAILNKDVMKALECLQDLLFHKVGDITNAPTDEQMKKLAEVQFASDTVQQVHSECESLKTDIENKIAETTKTGPTSAEIAAAVQKGITDADIVKSVEQGIEKKEVFLNLRAKAGAESALKTLDFSDKIVNGIKNCSVALTDCAQSGAQKALANVDFKLLAKSGAGDALLEHDFTTPAKNGALGALGTYNFVENAREGCESAIENKRNVLEGEAKKGATSAITSADATLTGYAQKAIDNKKDVITMAAQKALVANKISTQEEVRVAILSAYSAYALALDNAKAGFESVISRVINQTVKLNDATVQYQVLLLSTSEAAERLTKTAEVFKDVVFTAERYASTVADVLAIQQLQKGVLDAATATVNSVTQLRNEWAGDRKELFDTMSDVKKLQDIGTKFDMAYKSLQIALGLTERVQDGIKMQKPDIIY